MPRAVLCCDADKYAAEAIRSRQQKFPAAYRNRSEAPRMKAYRANPAAVEAFVRRQRRIGLIVNLIAIVTIVLFAPGAVQILLYGHPASAFLERPNLIVAACLVAIVWFFVRLFPRPRGRPRGHTGHASYVLEVTDDDLRRYRDGLSLFTVQRSEVVRISEQSWGIVVSTANGWKLNIPRYLDGYDELRETLRGWRPFETDTARNALFTALPIACIGAFIVAMRFAPHGRWWDAGANMFLAATAQAWMILYLLEELRDPDIVKGGRYALRGLIIVYTFLFTAVFLLALLIALRT
jgi:hypothetical protein